MILYINACVREDSRTAKIANAYLSKQTDSITELYLPTLNLKPLDNKTLKKRMAAIANQDYSDEMFDLSKQFANADKIVIAAPYWDYSFPAILKVYFENIYVTGIVSRYDGQGRPHGLCRASELVYITTAGGYYNRKYSFGLVESLASDCFGIKKVKLIKAEKLDIDGENPDQIIKDIIKEIEG